MTRCTTCGGRSVDRDLEGDEHCLNCGRSIRPVVVPTFLIEPRFDAELKHTIEAQRRSIARDLAAGRRVWA